MAWKAETKLALLFALLAALALCLLSQAKAEPSTWTGKVTYVADGDTITVGEWPDAKRIRLKGIAAPELEEPYGQQSKGAMRGFVEGAEVTCQLTGAMSYDRHIGTCYIDGVDIGMLMVILGLARDCPRFSNGFYAEYEPALAKTLTFPVYCQP